jgi:hypothetical protein
MNFMPSVRSRSDGPSFASISPSEPVSLRRARARRERKMVASYIARRRMPAAATPSFGKPETDAERIERAFAKVADEEDGAQRVVAKAKAVRSNDARRKSAIMRGTDAGDMATAAVRHRRAVEVEAPAADRRHTHVLSALAQRLAKADADEPAPATASLPAIVPMREAPVIKLTPHPTPPPSDPPSMAGSRWRGAKQRVTERSNADKATEARKLFAIAKGAANQRWREGRYADCLAQLTECVAHNESSATVFRYKAHGIAYHRISWSGTRRAMPCCAMLRYAMVRCATLCYAVLRCATLCYAVRRCATLLRCATLCYATLCFRSKARCELKLHMFDEALSSAGKAVEIDPGAAANMALQSHCLHTRRIQARKKPHCEELASTPGVLRRHHCGRLREATVPLIASIRLGATAQVGIA